MINTLNFELVVMDMIEENKIPLDNDELGRFAETLHQAIEVAIEDYCQDNNYDGYEPCY